MAKEKEAETTVQDIHLAEEMYFFNIGNHYEAYKFLGAKKLFNHKEGYRFTVWAPKARAVYLEGDFTDWNEMQMKKSCRHRCVDDCKPRCQRMGPI